MCQCGIAGLFSEAVQWDKRQQDAKALVAAVLLAFFYT
jgi:hypothetical protein